MSRRGAQSGFTVLEMAIVISLVGVALSALSSVFTRNHELVRDTRAHQRVEAIHRSNIQALTRFLRDVDLVTLSNFSIKGVSTQPYFSRVTGADLDNLTYTGTEHLIWKPSPIAVDGIPYPGAVYLVTNGRSILVGDRVPKGGFLVRQEGQSLVVRLTTYYVTSASRRQTRTTESVISVRN